MLAVVEVLVLVAQDRRARAVRPGERAAQDQRFRPASSGRALVVTYWWASGSSGTAMPTIAPTWRPQKPAQETTTSAAIVSVSPVPRPRADGHAGDAAAGLLDADDLGPVAVDDPGLPRPGDEQLDRAGGEGEPVGRGVQPAEDLAGVEQRVQPPALLGVDDPARRCPTEVSQPSRRCRSCSRVEVVATSRPPTGLKQGVPSATRPESFSTV